MKHDFSMIGGLYQSLGDAIAESPNGALGLSAAEKHALAMLRSTLQNMLAHVRDWMREPARIFTINDLNVKGIVMPDWDDVLAEEYHGRN